MKIKTILTMVYSGNAVSVFLGGLFLFLAGVSSAYSEPSITSESVLKGHVDSLVVDGDKLTAQGWVGSTKPDNKVVSISIWFADKLIYEGPFERFKRPDVVKAMERNDWVNSGWRINMVLPTKLKSGEYLVKVLAELDNGQVEKLIVNPAVERVHVKEGFNQSRQTLWAMRLALVFLFILLCTVYFQADTLAGILFSKTNYLIKPSVIFGSTLFLCFCVLISLGITGSSVNLGLQQTPFVQSDATNVLGHDQPVRSDEYRVFTPFAIAQYNYYPKFPIVNTNLGEDGQNMLVVGMAGVPVAHISAVAKPATWGFFLFDLKRALSWYWFFPIFACLFALWGVVALLLRGQWRSSFLIALWFSFSPYVAAWSNWPAYAVFFPSLALLSAIAILRTHSQFALLALGGILGLALAGFVLILYPPWQVSLGYVFLALVIGIVVRDKLYRNFNKFRLASFAIAIIISGLILWKWWSDANLAIQAMLATVYPGQRTTLTGGKVELPELLRGFTNLVTLNKLNSTYSNQSEIASFSYMLLPLVLLFALRVYQKVIGAVEIALAVSISFILYFTLVGIPVEVAQFSLWGRVQPQRAEIALGLSNILLCGLLLSSSLKPFPNKIPIRTLAIVVASIWAAVVLNSISHLHTSIIAGFSPGVFVMLFFIIVAAGYWLALSKFREFIYLNLALSVATTLPFNPINIAPHSITVASFINDFDEKRSDSVASERILVLGETEVPAMHLLASGRSVANGTFYYPQKSLWERLDKDHIESNTYNRYQHLVFSGESIEDIDNYQIDSPYPDIVRVMVDLEHFDFRKTGAGVLAAPQHEEEALRKNAKLTYIRNEKGWAWFQITGDLNAD
ncbi:conserved membrane hypothetical protein [Candidatus Methylobacter favarea]|uniref:YfhO family protein n=1 Tax=Candidatus Methylobacter favarea TaxID=2707345 RepID=A0A8S0WD63_9GAMM|nr:hypothetical protein [Candidatus Methylobacter favarea]CAA9893015.1 conserved membrane hypothetical protein [Candidatus Methylobacter favarea]